jgi:hypothetical protein
MKQNETKIYNMYNNKSINYMLITKDYLRLVDILQRMVIANQLTEREASELLHKSGLIKLKDNRWKEPSGVILTLS